MVLTTPKPNVMENPLIGPEPKKNNITAAIKVVTFASNIALNAWSKPVLIELILLLPNIFSSRILSKTKTLASTAMPTVNAIPAIPGRVNVAWNNTNQPIINKKFIIKTN